MRLRYRIRPDGGGWRALLRVIDDEAPGRWGIGRGPTPAVAAAEALGELLAAPDDQDTEEVGFSPWALVPLGMQLLGGLLGGLGGGGPGFVQPPSMMPGMPGMMMPGMPGMMMPGMMMPGMMMPGMMMPGMMPGMPGMMPGMPGMMGGGYSPGFTSPGSGGIGPRKSWM